MLSERLRNRAAIGRRKAGPLFVSRLGQRQRQGSVRGAFVTLLGSLGLRPRNPHQLRHSVATLLIAAGHPIADVAAYLGDVVNTVVKTYLHPTGASPVGVMEALLSGRRVETPK